MSLIELYQPNGYVNMHDIILSLYNFIFGIGGRGTGKTYNTLNELVNIGDRFLFLRRTQTQLDLIMKNDDLNPFVELCINNNWTLTTKRKNKYIYQIIINDIPIAYMCALSTIANLRGFNMRDVKYLVYDEFIPEKHEKKLPFEAEAFLNAYETINRNRELQGEAPLKAILLSNANTINSPILESFKLLDIINKMNNEQKELYTNDKSSILLFITKKSPISQAKSKTALYKAVNNENFSNMAIKNDFAIDNTDIKVRNIKGMKFITSINNVAFMLDSQGLLYARNSYKNIYDINSEIDVIMFKKTFYKLITKILEKKIIFESLSVKHRVYNILNIE